jgi:hypothetical protein
LWPPRFEPGSDSHLDALTIWTRKLSRM